MAMGSLVRRSWTSDEIPFIDTGFVSTYERPNNYAVERGPVKCADWIAAFQLFCVDRESFVWTDDYQIGSVSGANRATVVETGE